MLKVVPGIIYNEKNEIYICQRPLDKQLGGYYEFPGGKIEVNETEVVALARELKEELIGDIEIVDHFCTYVYDYAEFSIELCCYECRLISETLLSKEHIDEKFINVCDFKDYEMAPADLKVIEILRRKHE